MSRSIAQAGWMYMSYERYKAESEAQRGKPKCTLESEIRRCGFVVRTAPSALYWCVKVVIDCQAINDVYETLSLRGDVAVCKKFCFCRIAGGKKKKTGGTGGRGGTESGGRGPGRGEGVGS